MENHIEVEVMEFEQPKKKRMRSRAIFYEWTEHEIVKLIQAVKKKPELWKPSHKMYKYRNKRKMAWRDIEENVFNSIINLSEITSKWNNLRVQYKTYAVRYKALERESGSEWVNNTKWRHFDAMIFIDANYEQLTETSISNLTTVVDVQSKTQNKPVVSLILK